MTPAEGRLRGQTPSIEWRTAMRPSAMASERRQKRLLRASDAPRVRGRASAHLHIDQIYAQLATASRFIAAHGYARKNQKLFLQVVLVVSKNSTLQLQLTNSNTQTLKNSNTELECSAQDSHLIEIIVFTPLTLRAYFCIISTNLKNHQPEKERKNYEKHN